MYSVQCRQEVARHERIESSEARWILFVICFLIPGIPPLETSIHPLLFRGEVDRFRARQVAGDRAKVQGQMADVRQKVSGGALGPCRTFGCRDGNRGSFFSLWIFTKDHIHANYLFLNKGYEGVLNLELLKKCAFGAG